MQVQMKCLGGIEEVIAKRGAEFGQLLLDGIKTRPRLAFKANAGQFGVFNRALDNTLLRGIELGPFAMGLQRFKTLVNRLALAQAHPELDHLVLHLLIGLTQRLAVFDPHQMADGPPGQTEPVLKSLQRLYQPGPSRLEIGFELLPLGVRLFKQLADGRYNVLRMYRRKVGQRCELQQGIIRHGDSSWLK